MNLGATTEAASIRASDSSEDVLADQPKGRPARTPPTPPARAPSATTGRGKAVTSGSKKAVIIPEEVAEDPDLALDNDEVAPRRTQSGRISRSARLRAIQMKQRPSDMLWSALALVSAAVMILPGAILMNRMLGVAPGWVTNWSDKFRWIGELFA